ncbi:MAG: glycosyltransferase [Alphaproteobacteria bacterium]|nr:MAG: glycosyltransferase [Alphaproteobacteria bacterium]
MDTLHPPYSSPLPVILQVLPALKDGGVEKSAIEMAIYIKKQGWTPLVASAGGPKETLLAPHGIRHIRLPLTAKTPWGIVINAFRLLGIIRGENVKLVHARSRAPAWSAWLAAKMAGVAFLTTFHGTHSLKGGKLKYIYNSIMVKGPVVIANSQFIRGHIIENYHVDPQQIEVAPRGIEPEAWNPALFSENDRTAVRDELRVDKGVPLLLMVGRITRWKGHDLILDALGLMKDVPWVMAFAGSVDKNSEFGMALQAQAERLGIAERIRWLGSRNDVARLLAASTLAISGSTRPEAFGRVAIEAMAMGVPVVATGIGGSKETIIDGVTGWLVHPTSESGDFAAFEPQAMAAKLRGALQKPQQLASMGHAARAHVLSAYTVDRCCAAELQAYERVLAL